MKKRIISFVLALMVVFGLLPQLAMPTEAATSKDVMTRVSQNLPIVTYASPLSGASRVYSYSSSALSKKTTGYYIDTFKDQIVITQIANNGKAVYVSYPSSSAKSGYRSRWFATDDILGLSSVSIVTGIKASQKTTSYRMSNAWNVTSWGSVFKNDICTQLGKHYVNGKSYNVTIYPIPSQKINGVSGVKHKMALANVVASQQNTNQVSSNTSWTMPMKNAYCTWRTYTNMSWASYTNNSGSRDYHLGIDIYGKDGVVYAAGSGKVVAASNSNSGANGRYIIIQHSIGGKTIYSFYAHLKSLNVSKGSTVKTGDKIGMAGGSGYGSNSKYGTHLHFAMMDTLWSKGSYYGYATKFTGNKVKYENVTYYNPVYVISNGRLP